MPKSYIMEDFDYIVLNDHELYIVIMFKLSQCIYGIGSVVGANP